ncbi:UNVERIFIED_CONTAM: hypothetical protein Sradi_6045800 [Sesamum radiatum]|uniref:NADH-ubiquinone oxidoreductase 21kDa subunit N-terminal domain-containing protein n=1 Tax=Sesamum radiatum TaxID=300843 RepID=A0AAW2KH05_SESRA
MNTDITASAKPEYPVIDRNPPFTKTVANFNTLDYLRLTTITGVSVVVGYLSGIKPGIRGPSMVTGGLIGVMGGFMYAYQNSAGRLMGFFPNEGEVAKYKKLFKSFKTAQTECPWKFASIFPERKPRNGERLARPKPEAEQVDVEQSELRAFYGSKLPPNRPKIQIRPDHLCFSELLLVSIFSRMDAAPIFSSLQLIPCVKYHSTRGFITNYPTYYGSNLSPSITTKPAILPSRNIPSTSRTSAINDFSAITSDLVQPEITWQIILGALAGVTPFVVAGIEFSKRIVAQRKCKVCKGSGLVLRDKKYYFRCPGCEKANWCRRVLAMAILEEILYWLDPVVASSF